MQYQLHRGCLTIFWSNDYSPQPSRGTDISIFLLFTRVLRVEVCGICKLLADNFSKFYVDIYVLATWIIMAIVFLDRLWMRGAQLLLDESKNGRSHICGRRDERWTYLLLYQGQLVFYNFEWREMERSKNSIFYLEREFEGRVLIVDG